MSMELLFAPSFTYNGEITPQDAIVLVTEFSVNAPGQPGRTAEFQATSTHLQWRLVGDTVWINLLDLSVLEGDPGQAAEFQANATHLQWRLVGSATWIDLLPLSVLEGEPGDPGREVEFRKGVTHIQWRYVGDPAWTDLVPLLELKGEPGDDSPPVVPVAGAGIDIDDTNPLAPVISATFSGSYTALTDKPAIPDDPADIGAATAAQGAKADTALQPSDIGVSIASLVAGLVPPSQLPSYVDDVLEFADFASLPGTGETGKIYVTLTPYTSGGVTSSQFRWSGSVYAPIIASPGSTDAVTEGSTNLYFTGARVLATLLAGLASGSATPIASSDSVLGAMAKLQAQISDIVVDVPSGPTASGTPGSIAMDSGYLYVCTGVNQWKATPLSAWPVAYMVSPMTASGDLIYGGASGVATRLPKGTNGYIFAMVSDLPAWIASPYVLQTTYDTDMGDIAAALAAILG